MKPSRIPYLPQLTVVLITFIAISPAAAADEIEIAVTALKACVEPKIAAERASEKPSADALLRACNAEFQKAKDSLPSAVWEQIAEQIRQETQERLAASGAN